MKEQIKKLCQRSQKALQEADYLLTELESYDTSISRSYYACFYSAQACLLSQDKVVKSHSGQISMFGKNFIVPNLIEGEYGRILHYLFEQRQNSDYLIMREIELGEAEKALNQAQRFVQRMEEFLSEKGFI